MAATKQPVKAAKKRKPAAKPAEKNDPGRPTVCTPEVVEEFAKLIGAGNYFDTACNYLGFARSLAYDWLKAGEAGDDATGPWKDAYRTFYYTITRAEAQAEVRAVGRVVQSGQPQTISYTKKGIPFAVVKGKDAEGRDVDMLPGDLTANLEFLRRRYRKRWAPTDKHEITGEDGGAIVIEVPQVQIARPGDDAANTDSA